MFTSKGLLAGILTGVMAAGSASAAVVLDFGASSTSSNDTRTGASGVVTLSFADEGEDVRITADVANTTGSTDFGAGATKATLTGFGLDLVDGATFVSGSFVKGTFLDTPILNADFQPFGRLDVAGADNNNFNGGNANGGLPTGESDMFSFAVDFDGTASSLEALFASAFAASSPLQSGLRFQQVNAGEESDKLTNPTVVVNEVPLPAAGLLLLAGLGGLAAMRRRAA